MSLFRYDGTDGGISQGDVFEALVTVLVALLFGYVLSRRVSQERAEKDRLNERSDELLRQFDLLRDTLRDVTDKKAERRDLYPAFKSFSQRVSDHGKILAAFNIKVGIVESAFASVERNLLAYRELLTGDEPMTGLQQPVGYEDPEEQRASEELRNALITLMRETHRS